VNTKRTPVTILNALSGVGRTEGLAVDWINDWIYWSNTHSSTISMAKLDGSYDRVLVDLQMLKEPRGLAVDPLRGYLFWCDWGQPAHIGSASMEGADQRHLIVDKNIIRPNGIAVDNIAQYIYWVDTFDGLVSHKTMLCHLVL
jgi:low density lipoprotein receptor-related protein 5/6